MQNQQEVFVKMALDGWNSHIDRTNKTLEALSDEQLAAEVAPGRNRGVYLLGHVTGAVDSLHAMLDLGTPLYPQLRETFLTKPDKSDAVLPSTSELRQYWKDVTTSLNAHFAKMTPEQWFEKHTTVSAEDFAKEPHRNKLNVLLTRTTHQGYHLGQLNLLVKK